MAFSPRPFIEQPNLRPPIALIVDDPAPCINPLWYFRHQVDKQSEPAHERIIPLDFMQAWCDWISQAGIKGDFTVLPYPAGLGRVDDRLDGYDTGEVQAWMELARRVIAPQFDIHCEILTHTNALDLQTGQMLPQSEHDWMHDQDEATLTAYFAAAMQILKDADLPSHGLTQPCTFYGDEAMYARAILAAEKRVNHRSVTHNFLHVDMVAPLVPPRITLLDEAAGEAVVSVWSATDDYIWNAQERGSAEEKMSPKTLADRYLTEDGQSGRLAELLHGGGPLILVTHWQSLYSNGSRLGLKTYQEIAARIAALWSDRVCWRKLSELSEQFLVAQTARLEATATENRVEVTVTAPFATDILTVSVPTPWPLYAGPTVEVGGVPAAWVEKPSQLEVGKWCMRGSLVTVSLPVAANAPQVIAITAAPR